MKPGTFIGSAALVALVLSIGHASSHTNPPASTHPATPASTTYTGTDGSLSVKLVRHCNGSHTSFTLNVSNVTTQSRSMHVTIDGKRGSPVTVSSKKTHTQSIGDNGLSTTAVVVVDGKNPFFNKNIKNC
jgi:hypothetical protein